VQTSGFRYTQHPLPGLCGGHCVYCTVAGCIDSVPECFVLESLYNVHITLFGAAPQLDTVRMSKRVLIFVCIEEVCYEGTVRSPFITRDSPFLSANTFFLYLRPSSCRFFSTWALHGSLASKVMPRYLAVLACGTF
jgi:hypothetical protein